MDWLAALDIDQALTNVGIDTKGDWYRDPWGWPELRWITKKKPETIVQRLNSSGVWRAHPIDVPKENFGTRPAIVMDPVDRLAYQALVDRLSIDLVGTQKQWAYGWRLPPTDPERGVYARNDYQWQNFLSQLVGLANLFDYALKADVVSYFASIDLDGLADAIDARSGTGKVQERILDLIDSWGHIPGRAGLPQRSFASAVLANMYLRPIDDVLQHHGAVSGWWKTFAPGGAACRWMDDLWLFGNDPARLRHAQVEIEQALRGLGLNLNSGKTDVLEGERLVAEAQQMEHSAVDDALQSEPRDNEPLNDLVDLLLASPEHASRTSVRFASTRMREHEEFDRVNEFVEQAHRMPHVADHLARLFRDSGVWHELDEWYEDYAKGEWAMIPWSVAQLGTLFPVDEYYERTAHHFAEVLSSGQAPLPLTAVAAQRLASWDSDTARVAIREAAKTAQHPLVRRTLALAALASDEERPFIRGLLDEFEENSITSAMLEDRSFKPPKVLNDFD